MLFLLYTLFNGVLFLQFDEHVIKNIITIL